MKTTIPFIAICLCATTFLGSCTKSDLPEPGKSYHKVRLFDDTRPDPRNHSIRVAAANGKLLMTYGRTFEGGVFYNGAFLHPTGPDNAWILSDNDGNVIRQDTFPKGLAIGDAIVLPDNSFMIVTFIDDPQWQMAYEGMQIMHLDVNGVMSAVDTIYPPTSHSISDVYAVHLFPSRNGNGILTFGYQGDYTDATFYGEVNLQGDFLWYKEVTDIQLSGCAITDGGYLLVGGLFDLSTYSSDIQVRKVDPLGEPIWNKVIDCQDGQEGPLVASGNGRYRLAFADITPDYTRQFSTICEINSEGDILDSVSINFTVSALMPRSDGGTFVLSSIERVYGNITEQFNSYYVELDAGLHVTASGKFQEQSSDMLNAGCKMSDGKLACFGIAQTYDWRYYRPMLILVN